MCQCTEDNVCYAQAVVSTTGSWTRKPPSKQVIGKSNILKVGCMSPILMADLLVFLVMVLPKIYKIHIACLYCPVLPHNI